MIHEMNLKPSPFEMIACGAKTIELRLKDEKRQKIRVGDEIRFTNTQEPDMALLVEVTALHPFESFAELYAHLPLTDCGYLPEEVATASARDMDAYYPPEKQKQYGVLGIQIRLLH